MYYYSYTFTNNDRFKPWTFLFATDTPDKIYEKALNHTITKRSFDKDSGITIWFWKEIQPDKRICELPTYIQEAIRNDLGRKPRQDETFGHIAYFYDRYFHEEEACNMLNLYRITILEEIDYE